MAEDDRLNGNPIFAGRLSIFASIDVRGVTLMHDRIYVLTYRPNRILVYEDQHSFVLHDEIKAEDIYGPQQLVGSNKSNCLYVSDSGNRCVWKILRKNHQMTRWLLDYSWSLSLTNDGKVLMARWGQPFSLEVYRNDAVLLRRIVLPIDVEIPKHVVETSEGNFVVSHWDRKRNAWGISELSRDGNLVRSYDPKNDSQEMDDPCYLSIDAEDRVYIADCCNRNRVVKLDSKLNWTKVLLSHEKNDIVFPKILHFDKQRKQLIVVHGFNQKTVDIFNFNNR